MVGGGRASKLALSCPDEREMALEEHGERPHREVGFTHAAGVAALGKGRESVGPPKPRQRAWRARHLLPEGCRHLETGREEDTGRRGGRTRESCPRAGCQLKEADRGLEFRGRPRRTPPKKPRALGSFSVNKHFP